MDEEKLHAIKKYWPWAVGILAAYFIYSRFSGGGSTVDTVALAQQQSADSLGMANIAANVQMEQIRAQSASDLATLNAVSNMSGNLALMNDQFIQAQITAYQTEADISKTAITSATGTATAGLQSAGAAQASYNATIGQLGAATGVAVAGVAQANAASQAAVAGLISKAFMWGF